MGICLPGFSRGFFRAAREIRGNSGKNPCEPGSLRHAEKKTGSAFFTRTVEFFFKKLEVKAL